MKRLSTKQYILYGTIIMAVGVAVSVLAFAQLRTNADLAGQADSNPSVLPALALGKTLAPKQLSTSTTSASADTVVVTPAGKPKSGSNPTSPPLIAPQSLVQAVIVFSANTLCTGGGQIVVTTGPNLGFLGRGGGSFTWQAEYSVNGSIKTVYTETDTMPASPPSYNIYRPGGAVPAFPFEGSGSVRIHVTSPNDVTTGWVPVSWNAVAC